jgi:hypothetical protein
MPKYLTQKLTEPLSGKEHWFYAVQNEHNHDAGVEFSKRSGGITLSGAAISGFPVVLDGGRQDAGSGGGF